MLLSDFDYALPESAIANAPVSPRDHARLMKVDRRTGERRHRHFFEIGEFLRPGDLLVINNTKVLPARLFGHDDNGRRMEVFLLKRQGTSPLHWQCLVRPGKRVTGEGVGVRFSDGTRAILKRSGERQFEVFFPSECEADFTDWLHRVGNLPLPPYIKRTDFPIKQFTPRTRVRWRRLPPASISPRRFWIVCARKGFESRRSRSTSATEPFRRSG